MPLSDPALDFSAAQGVDLNDGSTTTLPTSKSSAAWVEVACTQRQCRDSIKVLI